MAHATHVPTAVVGDAPVVYDPDDFNPFMKIIRVEECDAPVVYDPDDVRYTTNGLPYRYQHLVYMSNAVTGTWTTTIQEAVKSLQFLINTSARDKTTLERAKILLAELVPVYGA